MWGLERGRREGGGEEFRGVSSLAGPMAHPSIQPSFQSVASTLNSPL